MLNTSNELRSTTSWYSLQQLCPRCPLEVIANATFGNVHGNLINSAIYAYPGVAWTEVGNNIVITSKPVCAALGTDKQQNVENAMQWNFSHLTWNDSSELAPPLRNAIFLRAGTDWVNRIPLTITGITPTNVQLGLLHNAATRGDKQGTWPVINFDGPYSGAILELTLQHVGVFHLGLLITDGSTYYMYDIQCIAIM